MTLNIRTKNHIETKYHFELGCFDGNSFEEKLQSLLTDLINHSEGVWDYFGIRYNTVMVPQDWKSFSTHPERIPYTTHIKKFKNVPYIEVFEFIFTLLKDVYPYYLSLPSSDVKENLRKVIISLIECSLNARYQDEEMREADQYSGRSSKDRDNGKIEMTETSLNRYRRAINEHARHTGKDPEKITRNILNATDNNLLKLPELMYTCDMEEELRKDIEEIIIILKRDLTLAFSDIRRGYDIWKKMNDIGIDVDGYLSLLGLPPYATVKRRLLDFMKNEDHIKELLLHMKDELPESYQYYITHGEIDLNELSAENAKRKKYPKKLRSDSEIENMVEKVKAEIYEKFPLAKVPSPRTVLLNPTHPAATSRAFNSTIKNSQGKQVNTIVMTPRTDHIEDYLPTFAHETTHALHKKVIDLGEQAGILPKGSSDSVSTTVAEDFSQLIDDEFTTDKELPYKKKYKGNEFPNFIAGRGTRFQVPYALTQLTIRKEFEKLIKKGHTGSLTDEMIWDLKYRTDKLALHWFSLGFNVKARSLTAFRLFSSYDPRDGVVYMKRYMMQENRTITRERKTDRKDDTSMKMVDAFRKRWGKEWIENEEARIMVHWLFLESGRNEKTELFYSYILEKPIDECLEELERIGLKQQDIV